MESFNLVVSENLGVFVVLIGAVAVAALALSLGNRGAVRGVTRRFEWVTDGDTSDSLRALLGTLQRHGNDISAIQNQLQQLAIEARTHFKRVGLVRYDAFDGVAGQQSYSLCLLDDNRNGLIISSLVGTNFSRGYAIEIKDGQAARKLGDEETQALASALGGHSH